MKYKRKQSKLDRLRRLMKGQCPIHGAEMSQLTGEVRWEKIACPRRDCDVEAVAHTVDGDIFVDHPPELHHLKTNLNATLLDVLALIDEDSHA